MRGARETARGPSRGRGAKRFHSALVVSELAVALVLAVAAGLLINSFTRLVGVDPGFRTEHITRMKIALPPSYDQGIRGNQFFANVLREVAALPGVKAVGMTSRFPLHDSNITTAVAIEGSSYSPSDQLPSADLRTASGGYFSAMGIPVLAGRVFDGNERPDSTSAPAVVINRAASVQLFGSAQSVGKRIQLGARGPFLTVVGVVGDIHDASLREAPHPQVYRAASQANPSAGSIVIQHDGDLAPVVASVRRVVASIDRTVPVYDVQAIQDVMAEASLNDRFTTSLLSSFAMLALVLAALGTYAVIAFGVAERTREIGVRMALGARAGEVLAMVLREGMRLFAIALPIALLGVWWANRLLTGLLFGVPGTDPLTIGVAIGALGLVTVVACFVPARRAARVDPTIAIRAS